MAQQYAVDIVVKASGADQIAKLEKALKGVTSSSKAVDNQAEQVAMSLQKLRNAANQATVAQSKLTSQNNKLRGSFKGVIGSLTRLAAGYLSAYAAVQFFNKAISVTGDRAAAEQRLKNLTSSTHEYETALLAARVASQRFGLTQTEATQALGDTLSRLSGLGYGLKEVNDIYTGFNTIARQSGVAAEDAAGAFLQLSQALGSGTLQGDELRSILERMPQLGDAIKEALGPSGAGKSIKELGSEGKLTGDVILKALTKAAAGADDIGNAISSQQLTFEALRQAADQLFVAFGTAFGPMVLSAVDDITFAIGFVGSLLEQAAGFATENATALANFASVALRLGAVVAVVTAVVKAVMLVKKAIDAAKNAQIALMALAGPKAWALIAAGVGVAAATTYGLAKANEAVEQAMADATQKAEENGQAMVEQLQQQIQQYKGVNRESSKSAELKKLEAAATKELAAAQREYQTALGDEQGSIEQELSVKQAILTAEKDINNAKLQQAQADLQSAKTQAEKEAAAQRIYTATIRNAELEYAAAISAAQAEQQKVEAALRHAEILAQKQRVLLAEAKAADRVTQAHIDAVAEANRGIQVAQDAVAAQNKITAAVTASAAAQRDAKKQAARTALEAQKITSNTAAATGQAQALAAAYREAASAAASVGTAAASAGGGGALGGTGGGQGGYDAYTAGKRYIGNKKMDADGNVRSLTEEEKKRAYNQARLSGWKGDIRFYDQVASTPEIEGYNEFWRSLSLAQQNANIAHTMRHGGVIGPYGSEHFKQTIRAGAVDMTGTQMQTDLYAEGGYVTGPRQAIVGEGGEPEYIIPESKMNAAMARYGAGQRGDSVIPDSATVNVNYGGSTVSMGGSEYINKADVPGLLNSAVNQTLKTLRRNSSSRLYAGFDR